MKGIINVLQMKTEKKQNLNNNNRISNKEIFFMLQIKINVLNEFSKEI